MDTTTTGSRHLSNERPSMSETPMRGELLSRLWTRMQEIYGHRWASSYGEAAEVDGRLTGCSETWGKGLAGITPQQVAVGLKSCVTSADPWPPTLPAFRAMCMDVPTYFRVEQAIQDGEDFPFMRQVRLHLDWHLYRQSPAEKGARMVRAAYELAREHLMSGGKIPDPPLMIEQQPEPQPKPTGDDTRAVARAKMAEARAALGLESLEELNA